MALDSMHFSAYPLRTLQGWQQPFPTFQAKSYFDTEKEICLKLDLEKKHPEIISAKKEYSRSSGLARKK